MEREEVRNLWTDYTTYWLQTSNVQKARESGKPIRPPKLTQERYQLFCQLHDWCELKGVDPRLWLFALFRSRRWMFSPQLLPGHLMSDRFLSGGKYQRVLERGALDGYRLQKNGVQKGLDPNKDIIPGAEQRKRIYLQNGQANLCMMMAMSDTYGFHPESKWCRQCPRQVDCQNRLQSLVSFDILALRRGEMTVEQARASANG